MNIVSEAWPPYIYETQGQLQGVDYDVTNRVLRQLGYQPRWQLLPWRRAQHDTLSGHADAILDISPNATRREQFIFPSEPLSHSETVLFYRLDRPHPFNGLQDLRGLRIGVTAGYVYGNAQFNNADYFSHEVSPSNEASLLMLMRDRVDMVMMNKRVGQFTLRQLDLTQQVSHHPLVVSSGSLFLAFHRRPELAELAERFGAALQTFKASQEYLQILQHYGLSDL
ncbi:MAG: transporter substrate-binding domain-containing protein [Halopseudomonas sp.]|uniref:substrate-binding periplasmic protein n=1 Tax=Halopseudomonas sp. TaxID=2901191 RepID=UPI003001625A